jgi:parallel beta-helix repeat protein
MNDIDRRFLLGGLAGAAGMTALAAMSKAGPLNPPAGPVASTGKTLTEVEPRTALTAANTPGNATSVLRITQAGSYYLTANLAVSSGKNGIEVAASGVTIDLNGFLISGFGGLAGIVPSSTTIERITVRNGCIIFCTGGGIALEGIPAVTVEHVSVETCSGYGIRTGVDSTVKDCLAKGNSTGIAVGDGSLVSDCRAIGNSVGGIAAASNSVVTRCSAGGNAGYGISVSTGSVISECAANSNEGSGGIRATSECAITSCTARFNTGDGIYAAWGCVVTGCTTFANTTNGIRVDIASLVRGNICNENGSATAGAGIRIGAAENRVEGNTCIRNYRGIYATAGGNFIAGNTCGNSDSVNWEIDAGNTCHVISAASSAAISGSSGGVSPGSSSPWANYSI